MREMKDGRREIEREGERVREARREIEIEREGRRKREMCTCHTCIKLYNDCIL